MAKDGWGGERVFNYTFVVANHRYYVEHCLMLMNCIDIRTLQETESPCVSLMRAMIEKVRVIVK